MAIEFGKGIALAGGFDLGAKAPLDSRLTVATIEERDAHVTGNRAYDGMLVFVEADKVTYQYIVGEEGVGEWVVFGFNEEDFVSRVANDLVTNDATKALSAAQGVVLKGLIDAEVERAGDAEDALQVAIDELAEKIGVLPEDSEATNLVGYVNEKAQEVLELATGGSSESAASVKLALDAYKAEVNPKLTANEQAAANALAKGEEALAHSEGVDARVDVLVGEDADKSVRTIANEELAKQLIAEGAKESLDTLAEIAAWIQSHPDDASAMNKAIEDLEALVGTLPEGITATTIVGYIKEVVDAEASAREAAIDGLDERLQAVEAKFGEGEGNVESQIAAAIAEEVAAREAGDAAVQEAAAADAKTKADKALEDAKAYADAEVAKDRARLDALELVDHEHANKEELDLIQSGDKAKWDDAVAKSHEHENAEELAKIVAGDVEKWNGMASDVTSYVDEEIADVKAIIGEVENGKSVIQMLAETRTALDAKDAQVEANAKAYADGKDAEVLEAAKADATEKANAVKAIVGEVAEGKTVVQMLAEAREADTATAKAYTDEKVEELNASIEALSKKHDEDKAALVAVDESLDARVIALEEVQHVEISEEQIDELFN